jgi:chaperonin cofactor prefoldin
MPIGTTPTLPTTRGTQRETFSVSVTPVDEKRFEGEMRRIDAVFSEEKKNREKFETRVEKAVDDLRGEMNVRFDKIDVRFEKAEKNVDARFDKMEKSIDARFEKMENNIDARFEKMENNMDARFEKAEKNVDARFDKAEKSIDARFDKIGECFDKADSRMSRLEDRLWWIFGAVILSILLPLAREYL